MSQNILVVTPLQEEYNDLYDGLTSLGLDSHADKIGKLDVHRFPALNISLAQGGHGKTQFGIQTQYILDHAQFDLVICAGAAGGIGPEVKIGDLVILTIIVEHDFNNKLSNRPKPQFAGDEQSIAQLKALRLPEADFNVHFGIMAGGDEDVIDIARGKELHELYNALVVAWEGVGGARACAFNEIPYLEVRGTTDTANHEAPALFDVNLKVVMRNIAYLLAHWLRDAK